MTIEQKQHLLAYLGYYTMEVDGIWGEQSKAVTEAFQRDYGLDVDGIFGVATESKIKSVIAMDEKPVSDEDFWNGVKYFERSEFACKCGKYCDGFPVEVNRTLLVVADRVREHFGKPAILSSGVRCEQHNANVDGVTDSRHLRGKAMDFRVQGVKAAGLLKYVQQQPEIRYAYKIDNNYIHMDVE